jgi:hypothetical protein
MFAGVVGVHATGLKGVLFLSPMLDGQGTTTSGATLATFVILVLVFVVSFAIGRRPKGNRPFSMAWLKEWLAAALPRITIAAFLSLAFYLISTIISDPQAGVRTACNSALRPITSQPVTRERVDKAEAGMRQLSAAATAGDEERVRTLFIDSDTHSLAHDIDGRLRQVDPELGRQLCVSVVTIENQLTGSIDRSAVQRAADTAAGLLEQAAAKPGVLQT